jgi:hypothetical protein
MHGPDGSRIHPGDQGSPAGSTDTGNGKGLGIPDPLPGELIQYGRPGKGITITPQTGTHILTGNPNNIWAEIIGDLIIPGIVRLTGTQQQDHCDSHQKFKTNHTDQSIKS